MKFFALITVLWSFSMAFALPVHNGMMFYHIPYYYNPYEQSTMFQYSNPLGHAGASTFTAGDHIAAGTLVKESAVEAERSPDQFGGVEAIAEAYPSMIEEAPQHDDPAINNQNEVIPLTIIKTQPENPTTTAPKKKVHVALDTPDANDDPADDEMYYAKKQQSQQPQMPETMFPMSFGGSDGGSTIAIANAYNAGGGPVRSHAIAYGIPDFEGRRRSTGRNPHNVQRKHANNN